MLQPATADIIPLIRHLVRALQPYGEARDIKLAFHSAIEQQIIPYDARQLIEWLTNIICTIIHYLPGGNEITVRLYEADSSFLIQITNTGVDLSRVTEIINGKKSDVITKALKDGSVFELSLPLESGIHASPMEDANSPASSPGLRGFYALIKTRLRSHFSKADNLVALLSNQHPGDAAFLEKVNEIIRQNLDNETFDTAALCKAMTMSRTQLFRKLKPLIRQAPAHYIRILRLERAKELLESSDLNISEVTFKTGFQSQSHFAKAFTKKYGVPPSLFRRNRLETK
jgi:AraC-like DNA-binding protein